MLNPSGAKKPKSKYRILDKTAHMEKATTKRPSINLFVDIISQNTLYDAL